MSGKFKQISIKSGFMKHNGGIMFRNVSKTEYEFKTTINKNHLNAARITHGGFICSLIDAGAGTAAHTFANGEPCVTISLDIKFMSPTRYKDEIIGKVSVDKKTKSIVFLSCILKSRKKIISISSGIWKILNHKIPGAGYGG